jgi:signal transduction histidine kinase
LIVLSAAGLLMAATVRDRQRAEDEKRRQFAEFAHEDRRAALSDMASHIVHDLSGPVTAVSSFTATALRKSDSGPLAPSEQRNLLEELQGHTERIKTIFQSIKQMGVKHDEISARFDIRDAVTDAMPILLIAAKPPGTEIRTNLGDEPIWVNGNRGQLQQVVVNLARNGIEAMDGGSGLLSITLISSAKTVMLEISDQGNGFAVDDLPELMKPFHTSKVTGTGSGLAIVKSIIEAHGGSLSARSQPNAGSTFSIELPKEVS